MNTPATCSAQPLCRTKGVTADVRRDLSKHRRHAHYGAFTCQQPLALARTCRGSRLQSILDSSAFIQRATEPFKLVGSVLAACLLTGLLTTNPVQAQPSVSDTIQSSNLVVRNRGAFSCCADVAQLPLLVLHFCGLCCSWTQQEFFRMTCSCN